MRTCGLRECIAIPSQIGQSRGEAEGLLPPFDREVRIAMSPIVRIRLRRRLAAAFLLLAAFSVHPAIAQERVSFPSADGTPLTGLWFQPAGKGPFPAVVGLHGCSGLWNRKGGLQEREADWVGRLRAAGYAVLLPDSLRPRGIQSVCDRRVARLAARTRAADAFGAAAWLAARPNIDRRRIALIGWSHGGSGALAVATQRQPAAGGFATVVAFYPGCREISGAPTTRVAILIGELDDWTLPRYCRAFAEGNNVALTVYPGAYHDFDWPNMPVHTREGVGPSGRVTQGMNPAARGAAITRTMALLQAM